MVRSSGFAVWILVVSALPASAAPPILESGVRIRDGDHNLVVDGQAAPDVVDWNNDGKMDLVVGQGDGKVRLYLNTGSASSPSFSGYSYLRAGPVDIQVEHGPDQGASPRVVDWNDDGKKDLLIGDYPGKIRIYINAGTDNNPAFLGFFLHLQCGGSTFDGGTAATPEVVDWNNDGKKDVLCGDDGGKFRLLINTGSTSAPAFSTSVYLMGGGIELDVGTDGIDDYSKPVVVDWNGDGKKDLLSGRHDGYVVYYENQGTDVNPSFSGKRFVMAEGSNINVTLNARIEVCDWNNDGMPDLVVGDAYGNLTLYLAAVWGPGTAFGKTQYVRVQPAGPIGETWQICVHNYSTIETLYYGPFSTSRTIAVDLPYGQWKGAFLYNFATGRWEEALWAWRSDW